MIFKNKREEYNNRKSLNVELSNLCKEFKFNLQSGDIAITLETIQRIKHILLALEVDCHYYGEYVFYIKHYSDNESIILFNKN